MPPAMGTMREVSGVTSSMAVSERSREVVGVAFSPALAVSSHWSGSIDIGAVGVFGVVGAGGEGSDADDAALDGAAETVGVGEQGGLRRGRGLELRGP